MFRIARCLVMLIDDGGIKMFCFVFGICINMLKITEENILGTFSTVGCIYETLQD